MHKTKKKSKTAKLPKPIKIKKEKSDEDRLPQPMTRYLDDRLEMVKQIFNTLKPKTIVNLAPDFLKTQALEDIEEACLNELLCISTKRLKSIITATKCPTDTESSDDSDVERREEHISLEEISSDSEIGGSTSKKSRKKKTSKNGVEIVAPKKDKPTEDNQGDGQISVLELLELQARARAIRSQLALEPVTKIEVDSDGEKRDEKQESKTTKRDDKGNKTERKRVSNERESIDSAKLSRLNGSTESVNIKKAHAEKDVEKFTSKKIKIIRNYRSSTNTGIEEKNQEKQSPESNKLDKEKSDKVKSKEKAKQHENNKTKETLLTDIKKEKSSRSPSPDVVPIVPEPETLLITDSSEDENAARRKNKALKVSTGKNTIEQIPLTQTQRKSTEAECHEVEKDKENCSAQKANEAQDPPEVLPSGENSACIQSSSKNTQDSQYKISDKKVTENNGIKNKNLKLSSKEKSRSNDGTSSANHSDDDQNEDVISLGGDLENEMNEQLENEVNAMQSPSYNKKPTEDSSQDTNKSLEESQTEDVISLESSEDERANDNQSWHSRYMKSSKVSKVLAASRLGKRVRDKIKKSKHSKKETSHENLDPEKEKSTAVFTSKHEDGSIEQYKELLEMRQRKSS